MMTSERGDFEFFCEMLPEPIEQQVRLMQIQTIARMIANIARANEELEQIADTQPGWGEW
jgi:hypothetical protein